MFLWYLANLRSIGANTETFEQLSNVLSTAKHADCMHACHLDAAFALKFQKQVREKCKTKEHVNLTTQNLA